MWYLHWRDYTNKAKKLFLENLCPGVLWISFWPTVSSSSSIPWFFLWRSTPSLFLVWFGLTLHSGLETKNFLFQPQYGSGIGAWPTRLMRIISWEFCLSYWERSLFVLCIRLQDKLNLRAASEHKSCLRMLARRQSCKGEKGAAGLSSCWNFWVWSCLKWLCNYRHRYYSWLCWNG